MGRGKVETKYIERKDHRQVTFSKRKNGLRKKIIELSVMCNAEIALIIFSKTGRLHQHSGEDTSVKQVVHRYLQHPQAQLRYDQIVRTSHSQGGGGKKFELCEFYEQLREMLCKNLDSMNHSELQRLEDQLENATQTVRKRKEDLVNRELHALEKDNQRLYKLNKEHESKMTTGKCIATDLHAQEFRNQNGYENVLSIISDDRCSTVLSMESSLYSGVDEEPAVPPQTSAKLAAKRGQSYEQRPLLLNLI